jgi:diaminohydroxyphosphoribosylaminopyrimidine deaminase / 5-amino-6-(5-phosphoribosylamino)uracil reductase
MAHQPLRIVVSRNLDLPQDGQLARTARDVPLWLLCAPDAPRDRQAAWQALGAKLLTVATGADGTIDMDAALQALGKQGLTRIFCEGGGALAASLLAGDLVDDLVGFTAGLAIGAEGLPAIAALGLAHLSAAPRFTLHATRAIGPDILHEWARTP